MIIASEITKATMAMAMIKVLVGTMPERVLRPEKMPMPSSSATVVSACETTTALIIAVAEVFL